MLFQFDYPLSSTVSIYLPLRFSVASNLLVAHCDKIGFVIKLLFFLYYFSIFLINFKLVITPCVLFFPRYQFFEVSFEVFEVSFLFLCTFTLKRVILISEMWINKLLLLLSPPVIATVCTGRSFTRVDDLWLKAFSKNPSRRSVLINISCDIQNNN